MEDRGSEGRRGSKWLYRPGLHGPWVAVWPVDVDVVGGRLGSGKVDRHTGHARRVDQRGKEQAQWTPRRVTSLRVS